MALPWTKLQDFYLRLGFLKVLVAVLDKARVSAVNEHVYRRLRSPLFEPVTSHAPELWGRIRHKCGWYDKQHEGGDTSKPTVAEALLVDGDCPSLLFAVTRRTVYKVLDWGRDVGFVGRGNQITERGLLLRSLLPSEGVDQFRSGKVNAWNPFIVTERERTFLIYHLCETDRLTAELIRKLGSLETNRPLELRDAGREVSQVFIALLQEVEHEVRPSELPAFRTALELAATLALEMEMPELVDQAGLNRSKLLSPRQRSLRRPSRRKLTKNTDHQTVPRLEQLADLGFVRKQGPEFGGKDSRRRWQWIPTEPCARWLHFTDGCIFDKTFLWNRFATVFSKTMLSAAGKQGTCDPAAIARNTWAAYQVVRRPVGHTPVDTVALYAMINACADGQLIEMRDIHNLLIALKRSSCASDDAFFAGGNAMDEMFVRLRSGFVQAVEERVVDIVAAWPAQRHRDRSGRNRSGSTESNGTEPSSRE